MDLTTQAFSEQYPIGTPVKYHSIIGEPEHKVTQTRSVAWDLCGTPVVLVEGITGGVSLESIDVDTTLSQE